MVPVGDPTPASAARFLDQAQGVALVVLLCLRGLVWDGDVLAPYHLVFIGLMLAGMALLVVEVVLGLRRELRWSWAALPLVLVVALLVPAALRSHLPVEGWSIAGQAALHGAFGFWLMQVIPGRERSAWGALVAGLAGQALIAVAQWGTVLPGMRALLADGSLSLLGQGIDQGDLANRVDHGGLFGTFSVSNTLAAFLALLGIPLAVAALSGLRARAAGAFGLVVVLLLVLVAFVGSGSKGGFLMAAVAVVGGGILLQRGWKRWLPLALAVVVVPVGLTFARGGLAGSSAVRWQYWQGAIALVQESPVTGHGVTAFIERSPQVMPLAAEPTRFVHNELLEAAVVGGVPLALVLAVALALGAWPRRQTALAASPASGLLVAPPPALVVAAVTLLGTYLAVFGAFSSNLSWWPGGTDLTGLGWAVVLCFGLGLLAIRPWPVPPAWALRLGAAAVALHALVDFDLHAFALVGCLMAVVVLAGSDRAVRRCSIPWKGAIVLGWLALVAGFLVVLPRAGDLTRAQDLLQQIRTIQADPAHRQEGIADLAHLLRQPAPADQAAARALVGQAQGEALALAASDPALQLRITTLLPPGNDRLARLDDLVVRLPFSSLLANTRSEDLAVLRRWDEALTEQQRAVDLSPSWLPGRIRQADLLERAAKSVPSSAPARLAEAAAIRAEVERLTPLVHSRNRMK